MTGTTVPSWIEQEVVPEALWHVGHGRTPSKSPSLVQIALHQSLSGHASAPLSPPRPHGIASSCLRAFSKEHILASLRISYLDDALCERLRDRATRHGLSMEEEVRQILTQAVLTPERLGDLFLKAFGPANGVDLDLTPRDPHEHVKLE